MNSRRITGTTNSSKTNGEQIAIPTEAWDFIESVLNTGAPDPHCSHSELICKEERRRIKERLEYRLHPLNYHLKR